MIPYIYDFFIYNLLYISEIYYHPILWVFQIIHRRSLYRYKELIRVPVHILTLAIIIVEKMGSLKTKNLGYTNHFAKIINRSTAGNHTVAATAWHLAGGALTTN